MIKIECDNCHTHFYMKKARYADTDKAQSVRVASAPYGEDYYCCRCRILWKAKEEAS